MMRAGACSVLETLEHDTSVKGCLSLPTVTDSWNRRGPGLSNNMENLRMSEKTTRQCLAIVSKLGWRWPASVLEWMMGLPVMWTGLEPLATGRFQQWLRSRGAFSPMDKPKRGTPRVNNGIERPV